MPTIFHHRQIQLGATRSCAEAIAAVKSKSSRNTSNAGFFYNQADDAAWRMPRLPMNWQEARLRQCQDVWRPRRRPKNGRWPALDLASAKKHQDLSASAIRRRRCEVKLAASAEFGTRPAPPRPDPMVHPDADQLIVLSGGDTAATIAAPRSRPRPNDAMVMATMAASLRLALCARRRKGVQTVYEPSRSFARRC